MTPDPNSSQAPKGDPISDGESINLGRLGSTDDAGSAIPSWKQLVAETVPGGAVSQRGPGAQSANGETSAEREALRQVLADEPPPSDIILKDPTLTELKFPTQPDLAAVFRLPPDLASTHPENSSIISASLPSSPGQSGITSDIWGSSSRVDLFRTGRMSGLSGVSLDSSIGQESSQSASSANGRSNDFTEGHDESSAVDLASRAVIDLPFPLGLDSTVSPAERSPSQSNRKPTVAPGRKLLLMAWICGGAGGLIVAVATWAALWFAGLAPDHFGRTTPTSGPTELDALRSQLQKANHARDAEATKAAAVTAEAKRLKGQLARATAQLTDANTAAGDEARARAYALAARLKQADAGQAELKASIEKLTGDKAMADAKLRQVEAIMAVLRRRLAQANTDVQVAKEHSASAEAASRQWATLAAEVARRLQAPADSQADLLAALDRALILRRVESEAPVAGRSVDPAQFLSVSSIGFQAYRAGDYAAADREFAHLAKSAQATAVHLYYLGLSQWRLGQMSNAEASFRRGWELERTSRPSPAEVEAAFERLDRIDREAVNQFRR